MDPEACSNEKASEGLDQPNETREHMSDDVANPEDKTGYEAITPLAVLVAAKGNKAKGSEQERIGLQSLNAFRCSLCRNIIVLDSPGEEPNDISTHSHNGAVGLSSEKSSCSHRCVDKVGTGPGGLAVSFSSDGLYRESEVHRLQEQVRGLVVKLQPADDGKDAAVADCARVTQGLDEAQQQYLRTHQQLTSERARCERLTGEMTQEKQHLVATKLDLQHFKAAFSTITDNLQRAVVVVDHARSKRTADTARPVLVQHESGYCLRDVNIVSQFKSQNCNWMMLLLIVDLCLLYWLNRVLATLVEYRTIAHIGKWLLSLLAGSKEWNFKVSAALNEWIMAAELALTRRVDTGVDSG
ncbi:hypothetical protein LTR27_003282 [Elasticomyces elasticus]|nr:hypothetical protein LTR27_003282 [Elasticomyces elasticus]